MTCLTFYTTWSDVFYITRYNVFCTTWYNVFCTTWYDVFIPRDMTCLFQIRCAAWLITTEQCVISILARTRRLLSITASFSCWKKILTKGCVLSYYHGSHDHIVTMGQMTICITFINIIWTLKMNVVHFHTAAVLASRFLCMTLIILLSLNFVYCHRTICNNHTSGVTEPRNAILSVRWLQ